MSIFDRAITMSDNPHFVSNGIDGPSPLTTRSLNKRKAKAFLSRAGSLVGSVGAKLGSVVNVVGAAKHGSALVSTSIHYKRLREMASKVQDGGSLKQTLEQLMLIKLAKLGKRGISLASSFVDADFGIGIELPGVDGLLPNPVEASLVEKIAQDLHWRAYREIKVGKSRGDDNAVGPALRICRELVCLSVTHLTGNAESAMDVGSLHSRKELDSILMEPCGYMVILYKLNQK